MTQPAPDVPRGPSILVVDDEPTIRALLKRALEGEGYRVEVVADARTALPLVQAGVDLVISDIMMPEVPGTILLRAIRKLDPEVPVLLITGYPTVETVLEAKHNGVVDYVRKPINLDDLGRRVRAAVGRRRAASAPRVLVLGEGDSAVPRSYRCRHRNPLRRGYYCSLDDSCPDQGEWLSVGEVLRRWCGRAPLLFDDLRRVTFEAWGPAEAALPPGQHRNRLERLVRQARGDIVLDLSHLGPPSERLLAEFQWAARVLARVRPGARLFLIDLTQEGLALAQQVGSPQLQVLGAAMVDEVSAFEQRGVRGGRATARFGMGEG